MSLVAMRAIRRILTAGFIASSLLTVAAPPAAADSCHLPKPSCTVYYGVCAVAAEADITCID